MKRVYKQVSTEWSERGYSILLDGKPIKTPAGNPFLVANDRLAQAIADEWDAQRPEVQPDSMKLTQLTATAIDRTGPGRAAAIEALLEFLKTDVVCYRADQAEDLSMLQSRQFDPLLDWFEAHTGASLAVAYGVMPITQPEDAIAKVRADLAGRSAEDLTLLQVAASVTGSLVIALALVSERLTAYEAFEAGFVEEIYQNRRWGQDADSAKRLAAMRAELGALRRYITLAH